MQECLDVQPLILQAEKTARRAGNWDGTTMGKENVSGQSSRKNVAVETVIRAAIFSARVESITSIFLFRYLPSDSN